MSRSKYTTDVCCALSLTAANYKLQIMSTLLPIKEWKTSTCLFVAILRWKKDSQWVYLVAYAAVYGGFIAHTCHQYASPVFHTVVTVSI